MVGPDYRRPPQDVPGGFKSATTRESEGATTRPVLSREWWRLFNDPTLVQLERDAIRANYDVRAALARVLQARAAARVTASEFYPAITLDPAISRSRSSGTTGSSRSGGTSGVTVDPVTGAVIGGGSTSGSTGGRTSTSVRIPFDLSYEIDVWGRVRRLYESAQAQVRASEDAYQVVLQTLEADVAQNYFTIRSLDAQAEILAKNVESYRRQVSLTQTQRRAGLVGDLDVAQAQALLNSTIAQAIDISRQRADTEHALAILLGRPPAEITVHPMPLDLAPPEVPPGLPADLLRQRPDVAQAEATLAAASAQIGVAIAAFYPTFRLTGAAGFQSADVQHALDWESRVWSIGPSVSFPVFVGGQLQANLDEVRARFDELAATYRGTVLTAFGDVEDSLTDLHLRADQQRAQDAAVQASRESLRLSEIQYRGGLANYLQVIDAERTLLTNELSAVQILQQRLTSTVLLIKAMGGGWDPDNRMQTPDTDRPTTRPTTQP
jgi:multidrug efflux system outer membrane protein